MGRILIIFDLGLACFVGVVLLLYTDLNNNIEFVVGWVGGDCHSYLSCVGLSWAVTKSCCTTTKMIFVLFSAVYGQRSVAEAWSIFCKYVSFTAQGPAEGSS